MGTREIGWWHDELVLLCDDGNLPVGVISLNELGQGSGINSTYSKNTGKHYNSSPNNNGYYLPTMTTSNSVSEAGMFFFFSPPPIALEWVDTSPLDLFRACLTVFEIIFNYIN